MDTSALRKSKVLRALQKLSDKHGKDVYLVGGAVRDLLLNRPWDKDLDFATGADVRKLSKDLAGEIGGHPFSLNDSFGTWRVVIKNAGKNMEVDLSPLQGPDILSDLARRDFTINSMAFDVRQVFASPSPPLLDPLGGIADLRRKLLRADDEESIRRDPLRMLRAYRFSATLGFAIEERTVEMIARNRASITNSAWERIRDEFFTMLDRPTAGCLLRDLETAGLLEEIFPEITAWRELEGSGHGDVSLLEHAFRTIQGAEVLLSGLRNIWPSFSESLEGHFARTVEEGISRRALLKFTAFFHDSGKPPTRNIPGAYVLFPDHDQEGQKTNSEIARRLKLSRRSIRMISELTRQHMRLRTLAREAELTPRAKHRFFHDLGEEGLESLLLALADALASAGVPEWPLPADIPADVQKIKNTVGELLRYYFEDYSTTSQKPLLNGKEIMKGLGVAPGKEVGYLLGRLKEAEIAGLVRTKKEALEYLKTLKS